MIDLYFGGAEVSTWRDILYREGVRKQLLTFLQLTSRIGRKKEFKLTDHFPDDVKVMVDSGGFTANQGSRKNWDLGDWDDYNERYQHFVLDNIERIEMATEFDHLVRGHEWVLEQRTTFYDQLPPEKFAPIWHPDHEDLGELCARYPRVGITEDGLERVSQLALMTRTTGVQFHGAAITRTTELSQLPLSTVASTSWLSPMKYGDTAVWDGNRMRRYPRDQREHARRRHKMLFERAGFDAEKIVEDDRDELTKFTIWSWLQLEEHLNMRKVSDTEHESTRPNLEVLPFPSDTQGTEVGTLEPRERVVIPVLNMGTHGEGDNAVPVLRSQEDSLRQCNTCYIRKQCPQFREDSECAYKIPAEIRTNDQMMAMLEALVEMQLQRIAFARMVEELEGGYPDQNLSAELDRMFRMLKDFRDMVDNRDRLTVQIEARGKAGMISQMFGAEAGQRARQLPGGGFDADAANVLTAELIDVD